ncbi:Nn.00g042050.m01.CDS01 [Neocucurbitaria sp. VM-36]
MASNILLLLGAALIASAAFFILQRGRRNTILEQLHISRRRVSGAKTPPRSLSPGKKQAQTPEANYSDTFPPSRRFTLSDTNLPTRLGETPEQVRVSRPGWTKNMLPIETSYLDSDESMYTPCEFSVKEIKALGNFPDYATLSGVPLPKPYFEFDIKKALPRPYRPIRWAYHQTMSLTKLEPDWWLELENTYEQRIKQRQDLYAEHGKAVLQALPGSELACKELMEMALQFLCARYPQYFTLDKENMVFHNSILKTKTDLNTIQPLHVLLNNVPEDFAIMLRDEKTGTYLFRAGIICSALGWNVGTKIGMKLDEIHAPIPDYKEKMQFSMDRYFAKKPTDKSIQRGSWGLEVDQPLYMPPGHPDEKHREYQMADLELSRCHLRVDWQTLRRLPLSAGVVFNFKALFTPIEEFRSEAHVPGLVLKVLNDGKKSLMEYKNTWHVEHVVKPALERFHKEQVEKGLVPEDWEPHTLEESPWFPDWEQKWHSQQGF